jgi:isopentenyl diphosphate isomerase/L-lactate dehydrogenase-like FMN-dependent dehydrogenase
MRALALGANAAFAGKSFLWAVAALGDEGPDYLIDLYIDELRASLGQIGAKSPAEARAASIHHPGAFPFTSSPRAPKAPRKR